jgi:hypothetical protein
MGSIDKTIRLADCLAYNFVSRSNIQHRLEHFQEVYKKSFKVKSNKLEK